MSQDYTYALGLDTATNLQCIALLEGDRLIEECKRRVKFDHSSSLLSNVAEALEEHGLGVEALDVIGVGIGPGSFTGTRIGLSLAKGLARQLQIPLAGVSSLAALAFPEAVSHPEAYVVAAYDARRQEVYTGTYMMHGDAGSSSKPEGMEAIDEDRLADPGELRERILDRAASGHRVVVVGNGAAAYDELGSLRHSRVRVLPAWFDGPSPAACAVLGRRKVIEQGEGDSLRDLEPNYIRASSAEENLKAGKLNVGPVQKG